MSGWTTIPFRQTFNIKVDLTALLEKIADEVINSINECDDIDSAECDEYYTEDEILVIKGTYDATGREYYARATLYEPEEHDIERPFIGDCGDQWLIHNLSEELKKYIKVESVEEDENDIESLIDEWEGYDDRY